MDERDRFRKNASGRSMRARNPRPQDNGRRRPTRRSVPAPSSARRSSSGRLRTEDRRTSTTRRAVGASGASRPSARRDVYVGARPQRIDPRVLLVAAIALVAIVLIVLVRCSGSAGQPTDGASLPAQQNDVSSAGPVSFTISFAGDCTLGTDEYFDESTSFNARYDKEGDPAYFFRNVRDIFAADDLTVVNMEGTLTESTDRQDKQFAFKGPAEYAQILVEGDIQAASLANNHSRDYGKQSQEDTISALDQVGISTFGWDRIAYHDIKGVKVALVGLNVLNEGDGYHEEVRSTVQQARDGGAQITIVYFHWGVELDTVPGEFERAVGRTAIDAGADLVVGSHPHVVQGYEKYNDRYIVYSLGNFSFGGNKDPRDYDCMIFQQTFTVVDGQVQRDDAINIIPCSVSSSDSINNYQPTPAEGEEADRINAVIKERSDAIAALDA